MLRAPLPRRPRSGPRRRPALLRATAGALVLGVLASCASLKVTRTTETSGTFESSARSYILLGWHMPRPAIQIAHENIADAGLPNVRETKVRRTDWGWFDWVLEIISTRSATVRGTWGYTGAELPAEPE